MEHKNEKLSKANFVNNVLRNSYCNEKKMRSIKAKKNIKKIVIWFTRSKMRFVVTENKQQK